MAAPVEKQPMPRMTEGASFHTLLARVPEAVTFATIEAQSLRQAQTPEGTFALTLLFAIRNVLRPALSDLTSVGADLMRPVGGAEYNPERPIDEVGVAVANYLSNQTNDIPHFWIRIEESGKWQHVTNSEPIEEGERFAVFDPLDMTSSIRKNDRTQTAGIAIYDKRGSLLTAGIMSLVDDGFVFIEKQGDTYTVFPQQLRASKNDQSVPKPIKIATLTRRMHALRDIPLFADHNGAWQLDCTSGYAVLSLLQGHIDAVVDPFRGNPWYENVIWYAVAQAFGYPVTDKDGNALDFSAEMRRVIAQETGNGHRMPAIVSRTPEIHTRVLELLKTSGK